MIQPRKIGLHLAISGQRCERSVENRGRFCVLGPFDSVMHPSSFAAGAHDAGPAQVCEVTRDFRLTLAQNLDEIADAHFAIAHEIEKPEAGAIREGSK